jgi:hypothetical protein
MMRIANQNKTTINCDAQNTTLLNWWGTFEAFLDSKTQSYCPFWVISLHQRNPTSFLAVKFFVTQKSKAVNKTVRINVVK